MIRQSIAMTSMNLQALPQRWGSALVDVFGVACVVGVFVGLFSIVATYQQMMLANADDTTLLVMKSSASAENESSITRDEADSIETEVKAIDAGALVSAEMSRFISLKRPSASGYVNVALRGVTAEAAKLRSKLKITAGRFDGNRQIRVARRTRRSTAVRRPRSSATRCAWPIPTGRSSACSKQAAAASSPRSGPTCRWSSPPSGSAMAYIPCASGLRARSRSLRSPTG